MSHRLYIILLGVLLTILTGCGVQQSTSRSSWTTMRSNNVDVNLQLDERSITVHCTMQMRKDSILVLSVAPVLGIEIMRLEASPSAICIMDKLGHQYVQADWKTVSQWANQRLKWRHLQTFMQRQDWQNNPSLTLAYPFFANTISVTLTCNDITWNSPIQIRPIALTQYKQVTLTDIVHL